MSSVVSVEKPSLDPLFIGVPFKLENIERMEDIIGNQWFKRAHLGSFIELEDVRISTRNLNNADKKSCDKLLAEGSRQLVPGWSGPKDQQKKTDIFLSTYGAIYLIANSTKPKAKQLHAWIMQKGIDKIVEEHKLAIEHKNSEITLLNDEVTHREFENVGLQGEIRAKDEIITRRQDRYIGYLDDENKNNGITVIAKNDDTAAFPYISLCGQHGYRKQKKL